METNSVYNAWLATQLRLFLGHVVLEVGVGPGNITQFLLDRDHVIVTDIDDTYLAMLRTRFQKAVR
ncbi:MAG: hypothetical protein HYZ73_02785 [Elusimicrobia bacterium]|nr:hypothetical protein [Elusimicrobiota bacterium]